MRALLRKQKRQQRVRKITAMIATASLLTAGLIVGGLGIQGALAAPFTPTVAADGTGNAGKDFILAGEDATFEITVSNETGPKQFNLGVTAMVPDSVSLVSGGAFGTPTIFRAGDVLPNTSRSGNADCAALGFVPAPGNLNRCAVPAGQQFWVWSDVNDLPTGGDVTSTVTVRPHATAFPVGTEIDFTVSAYTSSEPSRLPTFDGSPSKAKTTSHTSGRGEDATPSPLPVKALRITKSEPSPESELLRGVHDNVTTYTITVDATGEAATNGITVTDYLPAGLEYLGVAGGDQSTGGDEYPTSGTIPGTWTHSGESVETIALDAAQASALGLSGAGVYTKVTWTLPPIAGGTAQVLPGTPGTAGTHTFSYQAGIPLFENTLWPAGAEPDVASGAQAANLDNNTGPSTRHGSTDSNAPAQAQSLVNAAVATGTYTGAVTDEALRATSDRDTESVDAVDLRVIKSVATDGHGDAFATGTLATYTLSVGVSEYVNASNITLTDVIPNGLCPAFPVQSTPPTLLMDGSVVTAGVWNTTITPGSRCNYPSTEPGSTLTGATVTSIEYSSTDGTFTVVFAASDIAAGTDHAAVQYTLMQRPDYTGSGGGTSSGDVLTNTVEITGTTTPIDEIAGDPTLSGKVGGEYFPLDDSEATITSPPSVLQKDVLERGKTPATAAAGDWKETSSEPFSTGDSVWYRLQIDFADGVDTRGATLEDYIPVGVEYVGATYQWAGIPGFADQTSPVAHGAGTFPGDYLPTPQVNGNVIAWQLGAENRDRSSARFMPAGSAVTILVEGRVTGVSISSTDIDSPLNHAKYQQENVEGKIVFQRDSAGFDLDWTPTLTKGIKTNPHPGGSTDKTFDQGGTNELVVQGDQVIYRIDVTAPQNTTDDYLIWDVLPKGVKAADVSNYTAALYDGGTETATGAFTAQAYDTLPAGIQLSTAYTGRSVVVWNFTANVAGSEKGDTPVTRGFALGYTLTVPDGSTASAAAELGQSFTNTAGIVSYEVPNNGGGVSTLVPQKTAGGQELTTRVPTSSEHAVGDANTYDSAEIHLPDSTMVKKLVSTEVGPAAATGADGTVGLNNLNDANNTQTRIVQGEYATFEYSATIPAHTSVSGAVLADNGNFGGTPYTFVDGSAVFTGPRGQTAADLQTAGFTLFPAKVGADNAGTMKFPTTYTNTTAAPEVFSVRITVRVGDLNNNTTLTNTATFSHTNVNGGARVVKSDTAQTVYVEPAPSITKTANPSTDVRAGQDITYSIVVSNAAGRPISFDNRVVDTVPAGLHVDLSSFTATVGATTVPVPQSALTFTGDVAAGDGGTITWAPSAVAALGAILPAVTLKYTAQITDIAAAGQTYTNTATVTGYTLPSTVGGEDTTTRRGERTATDDAVITATTLELTKGVRLGSSGAYSPTANAPVGETASYEVSVVLHANINYYNIQLRDLLPQGVTLVGTAPVVTVSPAGSGADAAWNWTDTANRWTGTYSGPGGDILASTQERVLTFTYDALLTTSIPQNATTLTNEAGVSWTQGETGPRTEITDDATITVSNPNVVISKKVDGVDEVHDHPDKTFTYRVQARNTGTSAAYNMTFVDQVPAGVIVDESSVTASGGVLTGASATTGGGTITWTAPGPLAVYTNGGAGQLQTFTYTARFADSSELSGNLTTGRGDTLTNTVRVTHVESFPTGGREYTPSGPDSVADAKVVPLFPAVTLGKTVVAGVTEAFVGESFRWKLTATNNGQGNAQTITLTDTLPANWEYDDTVAPIITIAGVAAPSQVPTESTVGGRETLTWVFGNTTTAALRGTVLEANPANRVITVEFAAKPKPEALQDAGAGLDIPHTNTVSAVTTDTTGASENSTGSYTGADRTADAAIARADLKLQKEAIGGENGAWIPGKAVDADYTQPQWQITISNQGPDAAHGPFTVIDTTTVPAGVTTGAFSARYYSSAADTVGTPVTLSGAGTVASPYIVADTGLSLASDESDSIVLVADVTIASGATGTAENTASVKGRTYETPSDIVKDNEDDASKVLGPQADLAVEKTTSTTDPTAGSSLAWAISLTNRGPSVAESTAGSAIVVTDVIQPGVAGVLEPAATPQWTVSASNGWPAAAGDTITWTFTGSSLAVGAVVNFALMGTVDSAWTGGAISNTATVTPGVTPDPDPDNNTSTVVVTPDDETTLGITKTRVVFHEGAWKDAAQLGAALPDIIAGGEASYRVTVSNNGPADARQVAVVDSPPTEFTYSAFADEVGTWTHSVVAAPGTGDRFALGGTLIALESASFIVTYSVDDSMPAGTILVNSVEASAENSTNTPTDDDSNSTQRQADLSIEKSVLDSAGDPVANATATAGTALSYRLVVTNNGPSISSAPINVTDTLPAGMTFVSSEIVLGGTASAASPSDVNGVLTWSDITEGDPLAVGETVVIDLIVDIASTVRAQVLTNTATVAGPEDSDPTNNTDTEPVTIETAADMTIVKDVAAGPWIAGTNVTYTITVTNNGPSVADATVTDVLPTGLTAVSMSGAGWTCDGAAGPCEYPAHPVGTSTITVVAAIAPNVATGTELVNTATLQWTDTTGPHSESDPADITVTTQADLALVKTAVDEDGNEITRVTAGTPSRYQVVVSNNGTSDAVAPLTVVDTLPAGIRFVSLIDTTGWTASAAQPAQDGTQQVTFTRDPSTLGLASGASAALLYEVLIDSDVADGAILTNTATVSSGTPDSDPTNNTDTADVTVDTLVDLMITKSATGPTVIGETAIYELLVHNKGPSTARGIVVEDLVPASLELLGATGTGWDCVTDPATGQVTCTLDELLAGETAAVIEIEVRVLPAAYSEVSNTATVGSTTPELPETLDDNTSTVTTPVPPLATLAVTKTAVGEFQVGKTGTYSITVRNDGPTEDPGPITVTDVLPNGLTFAGSPDAGVSVAGQTVTWTLPDALAVGDEVTLTLEVSVGQTAYPKVENTATVQTPTTQTPDAKLTDSVTVDVKAADPLALTGGEIAANIIILGLMLTLLGAAGVVIARRGRGPESTQ
ncbi:isopeptide-forming domain-containing fimbrial protein [Microbacterium keratanolyticum]|uniref:isopeptide-forming domain-containing fimbrial protein n=1 Tax=Microbacterium keratanolyticum TaxID=67574 RepID=UPI00363C4DB9